MIFRGFSSAGISEAALNAEDIYEKIENPFREKFFILIKLLVYFFKISLLKKKIFLVFFSTFKCNPNKHCKFLDRC